MSNNNLSSNDKGLLNRLSNNNEMTIVSKNKAYFKGQFYEKVNNDNWEVTDISNFSSEFVFGM